VTVLDAVVLLAVAAAVARGVRLGAVVQLASFAGLCAGLVAGALTAPFAARLGGDPNTKALFAAGCLVAGPLVVGGVGRRLGIRLWYRIRQSRRGGELGRLDAVGGAVVAGGATLLATWLVATLVTTVPARPLAAAAQRSLVVRTLDRLLPPAPALFARFDRLFAAGGLPQVFAEIEPAPARPQPLPPEPAVRAAAERASASVVKIVGAACGGTLEGSGFVAGPTLVVTNAHVVAGVRRPQVIDRSGRHPATVVVFDPNADVAVLLAADLAGPSLTLDPGTVGPGTGGAVLGYPGGGPLDVEAAVVLARFEAVGRDIYSRNLVARQVYQLRTRVRPGNSGGPLVDAAGRVVGVVFSRSTFRDDIGFALTAPEVAPYVLRAKAGAPPVSTGRCAIG
jgi:S1-C subfamily serine protease